LNHKNADLKFYSAAILYSRGVNINLKFLLDNIYNYTDVQLLFLSEILGNNETNESLEILFKLINRNNKEIKESAFSSLCLYKSNAAIKKVFEIINSKNLRNEINILYGSEKLFTVDNVKSELFYSSIKSMLDSNDEFLNQAGIIFAGRAKYKELQGKLKKFINHPNEFIRYAALLSLFLIDKNSGQTLALDLINDKSIFVKELICNILIQSNRYTSSIIERIDENTENYFYSRDDNNRQENIFSDNNVFIEKIINALLFLYKDNNEKIVYKSGIALLRRGYYSFDPAYFISALKKIKINEYSNDLVNSLENAPGEFAAKFYSLINSINQNSNYEYIQTNSQNILNRINENSTLNKKAIHTIDIISNNAYKTPVSENDSLYLAFFFKPGCKSCQAVFDYIDNLKIFFPHLVVKEFDLTGHTNLELNEIMGQRTGIPADKRLLAPSVFTYEHGLVLDDINIRAMIDMLNNSKSRICPWEKIQKDSSKEYEKSIIERYKNFGVIPVITAGFIDGINPCAFSTIIFLIAYLSLLGLSGKRILAAGIFFTLAVFIVYTLVGFGFLAILYKISAISKLSVFINSVTMVLLLIFGILSLYDGIQILNGNTKKISLQLPDSIKLKIHAVIRKHSKSKNIFIGAFIIGAFISLLELACTGQIYAPTIIFMTKLPAYSIKAGLLLLLYNIAFIIPLIIVFILTFFGCSSNKLAEFMRKHLAFSKFLISALFFILLIIMLL